MTQVKNILYAEDNPDDFLILKIAAKRAALPQVLRVAYDGEVAIAWLRGDGEFADRIKYPLPDALILDLKMPRKSGFDVLEWLRQTPAFDHLPVVVLSSSDDPRDLNRLTELKATKYFRKSASCQDIIQFLSSLT